ncbi:hypothetical protein AMS59_10450 [Lysinibacillus sp. FJAT-14745]|uniref:hypothetical protein n=1 Tax=Lysinibacillus sp. FJAT-14745 TaxID=1704289 RepID=UPI0006AB86C7|nr:hypothetical protein [Lysinibacillus sp. FJAT-14745]KOP78294.1 hypothetical protein AMS59_10450 [Lysinibacillus sp. FJAT-14745]
MKKRIRIGIFIWVVACGFDIVTTRLGLAKKVTSFNELFPMTVSDGIFIGINTALYLCGLFVFLSGILQLFKRQRHA